MPRSTAVLCCLLVTLWLPCPVSCLKKLDISDQEVRAILVDLIELELKDLYQEIKDPFTDDLQDVLPSSSRDFLYAINEQYRFWQNKVALAEWQYLTNLTDVTRQQLSTTQMDYSEWHSSKILRARHIFLKNDGLSDYELRQLRFFLKFARSSTSEDVKDLEDIKGRMMAAYSNARVCRGREDSECMSIEPGLMDVMATSRDPKELLWAWEGWRQRTGPIKSLYTEFVEKINKGARENGYMDYGEYWRDEQFDDTPNLEKLCDELWEQVKPLYLQLHTFVRRKLTSYYGKDVVGTNGAIPAHLLGNMWAQTWQTITDIVSPISNGNSPGMKGAAETMLKENYDVGGLFHLAEDFYKSIGLFPMTETFWEKSMFVKPKDREVVCHASASDMFANDDFRIKMCTNVSMDYLNTIHHEMGHVQYFMAYSQQPTVFRTGANSGFHEAVGDAMALSVSTRTHLENIKLIDKGVSTDTDDIEDLLFTALMKVAFLPYGYMLDKWRWNVFNGTISNDQLNKEYWKYRLKYQGVVSPISRSEADFDPAAKFHVVSNSPYMCYFISFLAQFQIYQSLCSISGYTGPLHKCDFYQSKAAGAKLKSMLELGASKPWPDVLFELTASRTISVEPLLEYFKPLVAWLEKENSGEQKGWKDAEINWKD